MKNLPILLLALLLASAASAQEQDYSYQVLVPLNYGVVTEGAFGSEWEAELWITNRGDSIRVNPCGIILRCQFPATGPSLPPDEAVLNRLASTRPNPGIVFFFRPEDAAQVHFGMKLFERSEGLVRQGIEIPIIREEAFLEGVAELVAVPVAAHQRVNLRLYDPDAATPAEAGQNLGKQLLVEVFTNEAFTTPALLASEVVTFVPPSDDYDEAVTEPSVVQLLDLRSRYPELQSEEHVRIRLTPLTGELRFWAMATVTDNDTQYVSLITPQ